MAGLLIRNLTKTSVGLIEKNSFSVYHLQDKFTDSTATPNTSTSVSTQKSVSDISKRNFSTNLIKYRSYTKRDTSRKEEDYSSDSDSDNERVRVKGKEKGTTEFWRRKMRTIHGLLDINKDGVISYDDFKLLADKFASLGHLTEDECQEFQEIIQKTWEEQWGEITPYNLVTVEQYLIETHHMLNDKDLSKKMHLFLPYLFKAVDKDNSGCISLAEFKLFFKCLGLTEQDAVISFSVIDKNNDGILSMKEFVKLGREYFFCENEEKASKMFWGPLMKH